MGLTYCLRVIGTAASMPVAYAPQWSATETKATSLDGLARFGTVPRKRTALNDVASAEFSSESWASRMLSWFLRNDPVSDWIHVFVRRTAASSTCRGRCTSQIVACRNQIRRRRLPPSAATAAVDDGPTAARLS